jgi:universal stress protein E
MRLSPVPLLIVKQPRLYHRPQVLAALDPNHAYAKPAQLDTDILNLSTELGGALHGQVHAIHAFAPAASSNHPSTGATAGAAIQTDLVARQTAAASLDTLLKGSSVAVDNRHLVCGHPADVLARGASALEADILVLGCICRSGVRRLMIGNTAEHLIYRVPCDLLLVKPAGFANDIEHERRGPRLMVTPVCN